MVNGGIGKERTPFSRHNSGVFMKAAFVWLIAFSFGVHAHETCSHKLQRLARDYNIGSGVSALTVICIPIAIDLRGDAVTLVKAAKVLDAADVLGSPNLSSAEQNDKAARRLGRFYDKLVKTYPLTKLSEREVAKVLRHFNRESVDLNLCNSSLGFNGSLITFLFKDGKLDSYRHTRTQYKARIAQAKQFQEQKQEAALIRQQKNNSVREARHTGNGDWVDLSDSK